MALEPWSDPRGDTPIQHRLGDYGLELGAEYRSNWSYVNPIALNQTRQRRASWIEHRLRLDSTVDYDEKVRLVISMDALDGVIWGDNGTFASEPSSISGTRAAATTPNVTRPGIGYQGQGDLTDPRSYGYVLVPAETLVFRRAYGEVATPVGVLRIGRQPTAAGPTLLVDPGDGQTNRFGFAGRGDSSDRFLFATKPLEGLRAKGERDLSPDRGLVAAVFYDRVVSDEVQLFGDDLHGGGIFLKWAHDDPARHQQVELHGALAHRWETEFDTNVTVANARAVVRMHKLSVGAEVAHINGATREVSEAVALINSDPVVRQDVRQWGARGVVRWDERTWTAYFEVDFASGDRNPNPGSDLTQFYFAEDNNVGLLMFERILHFESARSAAAGVELLRTIGAPSFPAERVDTEGSFTNALAIFPQFDLRVVEDLLLRSGVLLAWAPSGLVDPIQSLDRRDGREVEDDLVNFNGGRPGTFYGVELDSRIQWMYLDHFYLDLEGAIFFPGDVFHNKHGQAARSVLLQGRTTFIF